MALNKATLKTAIENAFAAAHGQGLQPEEQTLAQAIADAIDTYVKAGTVSTVVATPDTLTGTGTGSIA
jgi:hypothetical protein